MPSARRPKPANGPALGKLMNSLISLSVIPCFGFQSSGHWVGSMVKSFGPLYTPSMRPNLSPMFSAPTAPDPDAGVVPPLLLVASVVAVPPPVLPVVVAVLPLPPAVVALPPPAVAAGAFVDEELS